MNISAKKMDYSVRNGIYIKKIDFYFQKMDLYTDFWTSEKCVKNKIVSPFQT